MPRQPACRDGPWGFLQGHLLIIPIHRLLGIDGERSSSLAIRAETDLDLFRRVLEEWPERRPAFPAVEFDVLELGKDAGTTGDHSGNADEAVEVALTQVSQGETGR